MQAAPATSPCSDPFAAMLARDGDAVLAVITGVEGSSYRPVGAVMAVFDDGGRTGSLSSGCVEADIAAHAARSLAEGSPRTIRYGRGSPYMDIQLPCGGGLDILLVPRPDRAVLADVTAARRDRRPCTLEIGTGSGALRLAEAGETGQADGVFRIRLLPDLRFLIFGKGPETSTFASLVLSAGYPGMVLSPDAETLDAVRQASGTVRHLRDAVLPDDVAVDPWTAVTLFFHDHDWEPPILRAALRSPAFYVGAQGSQQARAARLLALEALGLTDAERARLHGPIGLIPSARDPRTLAVSVLAEILAEAHAAG